MDVEIAQKFRPSAENLEVKYGLPTTVEYCSVCVISNQRPNSAVEFLNRKDSSKETIRFLDGVCDACRFAEKKRTIDWQRREEELEGLCERFRSHDGSYDCLVPGSGGKDSFYASHILRNKYGMHPLTVTWAPHLYTDWGRKNHDSWINAGHDNLLMTPNGRVHRLLTRLATENLFHPFQPFMLGQKLLAPRIARQFGIELVFYGENEAEYGNPISDTESATRSENYYSASSQSEFYLGGVPVSHLLDDYGLELVDLQPYLPLTQGSSDLEPQVHYLGYYLKWHPQACYYYAVEHGGFIPSPERTPGTYSKYNSIDDKIDDLHYYTTGVKFGIGRATYDAAQEIRSGDITRDEGVALVRKFDHEYPSRFMPELMQYLSISPGEFPVASQRFERPLMDQEYFGELADSFRSPHLWIWQDSWKLRHPVT